jgi:hypothetical protein
MLFPPVPTKNEETTQLAVRFPAVIIQRLDAVAKRSSTIPGVTASRSELLRELVTRGLDSIERELRMASPRQKRPRRARKGSS